MHINYNNDNMKNQKWNAHKFFLNRHMVFVQKGSVLTNNLIYFFVDKDLQFFLLEGARIQALVPLLIKVVFYCMKLLCDCWAIQQVSHPFQWLPFGNKPTKKKKENRLPNLPITQKTNKPTHLTHIYPLTPLPPSTGKITLCNICHSILPLNFSQSVECCSKFAA